MKRFLIILANILVVVPVLSCAPDDSPSSEPVDSFSIGAPVLSLVYLDDEIWAGTSEGVFRCNPGTGKVRRYTENDGLGNNVVRKITSDSNGNIWVTCYCDGVCRFDGDKWRHFTVDDGLVSDQTISLAAEKQGGIWVSAYWGVSYYDGTEWFSFTSMAPDAPVTGGENPNSPDAEVVEGVELSAADVIFVDSKGIVWFSNRHDGVTCFDGVNWTLFSSETGMEARDISVITEDKEGNLWFGSGKGITRFDGSQFTTFPIEEYQSIIPRPYVQDIRTDESGGVWIATYGGGCSYFNGTDWHVYNSDEGLPGKNGQYIFFDREGNPGAVTDEGVSILKNNVWKALTKDDGIPDGKIRSITTDDSDAIWFGSENGKISRMR